MKASAVLYTIRHVVDGSIGYVWVLQNGSKRTTATINRNGVPRTRPGAIRSFRHYAKVAGLKHLDIRVAQDLDGVQCDQQEFAL